LKGSLFVAKGEKREKKRGLILRGKKRGNLGLTRSQAKKERGKNWCGRREKKSIQRGAILQKKKRGEIKQVHEEGGRQSKRKKRKKRCPGSFKREGEKRGKREIRPPFRSEKKEEGGKKTKPCRSLTEKKKNLLFPARWGKKTLGKRFCSLSAGKKKATLIKRGRKSRRQRLLRVPGEGKAISWTTRGKRKEPKEKRSSAAGGGGAKFPVRRREIGCKMHGKEKKGHPSLEKKRIRFGGEKTVCSFLKEKKNVAKLFQLRKGKKKGGENINPDFITREMGFKKGKGIGKSPSGTTRKKKRNAMRSYLGGKERIFKKEILGEKRDRHVSFIGREKEKGGGRSASISKGKEEKKGEKLLVIPL